MPRRFSLTYSQHPATVPCIADRLEQAIEEGQNRNGTAVGELLSIFDEDTGFTIWPEDERAKWIAEQDRREEEDERANNPDPLLALADRLKAPRPGAHLEPAECAAVLMELERWIGNAGTVVTSTDLDEELIERLKAGAGELYRGDFHAPFYTGNLEDGDGA